MKFVFNFIFYGILFYLIWRFLPETFDKLLIGADKVYDVLQDLFLWGLDLIKALIIRE